MVGRGGAGGPAPHSRYGWRATTLRAPSPAARARRRHGPRTRAAHRHSGQGQLGHSNLGITSIYLQGIDNAEIIDAVHARRAPMVPVSATLRLSGTTVAAPRASGT